MKVLHCIILISGGLFLNSCNSWNWESESSYTKYKPTLLARADLEKSVSFSTPQSLKKPGKIYFYNNYIFIGEQYKGIHIIDNTVPESPTKVGFISIPGCVDMAVKGNVLYADNAIDMVCLDISNISNVREVNRVKNVFPEISPPDGKEVPSQFLAANRPKNTVIIDWK